MMYYRFSCCASLLEAPTTLYAVELWKPVMFIFFLDAEHFGFGWWGSVLFYFPQQLSMHLRTLSCLQMRFMTQWKDTILRGIQVSYVLKLLV